MMKRNVYLAINSATVPAAALQINVTAAINSKQITKQTLDGREYYVLPSYTLPKNVVMNGVLYPEEEIDKHYKGLEGTLAPLGHPVVNGKAVSAFTQEGLSNYCGAANRNVQKMGDRIYLEKWVDIQQAELNPNGRRLLERIRSIQDGTNKAPIHSSVALFINRKPVAVPNNEYEAIAEIMKMDHDAILLDEPGAATPEQGVGLMVNSDLATQLTINEGLLSNGYRQRERIVQEAAREQFKAGDDDWVHIAELNDTQAVVVVSGKPMLHSYTVESGKVKFSAEAQEVTEKSFWAPVVNTFNRIFKPQAQKPAINQEPNDMTAEERAAFLAEVQAGVSAIIKPVADSVSALQANQDALAKQIADAAEAPTKAKETEMRDALKAAGYSEIVANALSGAALTEMHSKLGTAAQLQGNNSKQPATIDMAAHFGVAAK